MIFIRLSGGLGNQLFQLAAALHLRSKTNLSISFYTEHLKDYETPREFMLKEILPKEFPLKFKKPSSLVQIILKYRVNKVFPFLFKWSITTKNIQKFQKSSFYVLDDYFQDISLFENELATIAGYIQNAASTNKKVTEICNLNNGLVNSIALHIRRGDFLSKANQKVFCVQEFTFYQRALDLFAGIENAFVFCENDINDIENFVIVPKKFVKLLKLNDVEEFLLMSRFPNLIIANSTYSFWAAIASQRSKVVAPKNWLFNKELNNCWLKNIELTGFTVTQ